LSTRLTVDKIFSLEQTHVVDAGQFDLCRDELRFRAASGWLCYALVATICETGSVEDKCDACRHAADSRNA
jgi:hypothetical protein